MYCPNCGSRNIDYGERGFNWENGIMGSMLMGNDGFLIGFIGSNDIVYECEDCGFEWEVEE